MAARIVIASRLTDHIKLTVKKLIRHRSTNITIIEKLGLPLCSVEHVPEDFREDFILKGYRSPDCTIFQCICSVFTSMNETVNFWTHFLPALYFFYTLFQTCNKDFIQNSYNFPLISYLFACILYPFASSMAHMFFALSTNARHVCFFLDYGAVSLYSFGSSIAYRAYTFPQALEYTWYGTLYLPIASVCALFSTICCCQSRFNNKHVQILRIFFFSCPYIFDNSPIFMLLMPVMSLEEPFYSKFYHSKQILYCSMAVLMYVFHFPECLKPGNFDIFLHSHQFFHVFGAISTFYQMKAIQVDMTTRRTTISKQWVYDYFHYSFLIMLLQVLLTGAIIFRYCRLLQKQTHIKKNE
ncbi:membrane progestin receptor gamma, partial [Argonauta hians]